MGREIDQTAFSQSDFADFKGRLDSETALLLDWLKKGKVERQSGTCGLELEACLIRSDHSPAPENAPFIEALSNPLVVPELAKFNFEINTPPFAPSPDLLRALEDSLTRQWQACSAQAELMGLSAVQIGILPTLRDEDLCLTNVSGQQRYLALNQQILKGRQFQPFRIDIRGDDDRLTLEHTDVMTEAATTSLQIHVQVSPQQAVRFYNAALIASAPMVAACANSPLLFGKRLWPETRIPLFEQSVAIPCFRRVNGQAVHRVCFGSGYLQHSVAELFIENRDEFPILLPMQYDDSNNPLAHLQLHNGTIWRWNRPLLHVTSEGLVQLRIEHRAIPAGPTITDSIANIALFYGLSHHLATLDQAPEKELTFDAAQQNFYAAARYGLKAPVTWTDGRVWLMQDLLLQHIIPAATSCLFDLGLAPRDIEHYMNNVMQPRVRSAKTGAQWQMDGFSRHSGNVASLLAEYQSNQSIGPVHLWR
ncbi:MAG: hypothetical protein CMN85_12260 [Spongiibacteraceae bacterium]|nr:hypothetical protein [Spongiibacteraceae bacterium]